MLNFLVSIDAVGRHRDSSDYQNNPILTQMPEKVSKCLSILCLKYDIRSIKYLNSSACPFGLNQCTNLIRDIETSLLANSNECTSDASEDDFDEFSV